MSLSQQEFTNAGRAMLGRAQNGETLTISKIVVGSGVAGQPSDLWPLTALLAYVMDVPISTKNDYGQGTLLVEGSVTSNLAPHAFNLCEVGIMAHIGAEADALYCVANVFTDPPDYVDPAAPTVEVFKIKLIIDRIPTAQLVVQIGPSENVVGQNLDADTVGPGVYHDAAGNVLNFKRIVQGVGMDIHDSADGRSIYVGVKTLQQNLDLYVPMTYPGITDQTTLFPTIQAALDSVANTIIPPQYFVTVHVYKGNFPLNVGTTVTHPNSKQIKITGLPVVQLPVTGMITVAGTLPNFDVTVNVANAPVAVGDVVHLFNAPTALLELAGYVEAVTAATVKIRMYSHIAVASIAAVANTKLVVFPTQMSNSSGNSAFNLFDCKNGIGLIQNFGLRCPSVIAGAGAIVVRGDDGNLQDIAAVGFDEAIGNTGGTLYLTGMISCNANNVGLLVAPFAGCIVNAPSAEGFNRVVFSGNLFYGIWINGGSFYSISNTSVYACSNTSTGVRCDHGYFATGNSPATTGGSVVIGNDVGCSCHQNGSLFTTLNATNTITNNVTWDCQADASGQIGIVHNINNTGRYSPALGVLGPSGGFVSVQTP